jgi:uncharacterized repeat protein (TIGR04138 family)
MAETGKQKAATPAPPLDLETAIRRKVLPRDPRFAVAAYIFLYESLNYTQRKLKRDDPTLKARERHVSGQELLGGVEAHARESFGPLAPVVFRAWGVTRSADFGDMVFNLIEAKLLRKTAEDRIEDFHGGFDIDTAFEDLPGAAPQ